MKKRVQLKISNAAIILLLSLIKENCCKDQRDGPEKNMKLSMEMSVHISVSHDFLFTLIEKKMFPAGDVGGPNVGEEDGRSPAD